MEGHFREDIYRGNPFAEWQSRSGKLTQEQLAERRRSQVESFNRPQLVRTGAGPEFTTCKSLQRWPAYVADINGYYRELGIRWDATHRQIKEAYQSLGGECSVRLTFVVKQLLNAQVRKAYDSTPLGSVFFDSYVAEYVKDQMRRDELLFNGRSRTFQERIEEGDVKIDLNEFLNREFSLDETPSKGVSSNRWQWSFYQLRTSVIDHEKLRAWQLLLVSVWSQSDLLCVGLIEGPNEVELHQIGYRHVAFINVNTIPTKHLATKIYLKYLLESYD